MTHAADRPSADHCRINYVELNVHNIDRAKGFYGDAFGWTFTDYGPSSTKASTAASALTRPTRSSSPW